MNLSPEEREIGQENYYEALGAMPSRRDFLKGSIAAGAVSGAGLGAMCYGYGKSVGNPVRIGVIGTGDEGNILIGALNPEYVEVVAISDIRPSSIHRAFHGDWGGGNPFTTHGLRPGLMQVYDWKTEDEARQHVTVYEDYRELLKNSDVEGVIIALPLFLHAEAAIAAMRAGKHVLTEKLMAQNVAQCKWMGRVAAETGKYLATGHQRHYNILYDHAVHMIRWGLLGELHHIRAQWHRGNLPGNDSWAPPLPGGEMMFDDKKGKGEVFDQIAYELDKFKRRLKTEKDPKNVALLGNQIAQWTAWDNDKSIKATEFGYEEITLENNRVRSAIEELVRWRLWQRTGGGLMAELGSHQLDAASIFVSAMREDGQKSHPLTVHAVGGRHIFPLDRDAYDHVYCMFEFPAPGYDPNFNPGYRDRASELYEKVQGIPSHERDENKKIVMTYSSINGNGFGGYGEIVMGTKGTLVLEKEQEVMLYKTADTSTKVGVTEKDGGPVLDTQASGAAPLAKAAAASSGPVSRGYTEEIEHWAWCIRNQAPENQPKCPPKVALADAVLALTTQIAMDNANSGKGGYIKFEEGWFDIDSDDVPDAATMESEKSRIGA